MAVDAKNPASSLLAPPCPAGGLDFQPPGPVPPSLCRTGSSFDDASSAPGLTNRLASMGTDGRSFSLTNPSSKYASVLVPALRMAVCLNLMNLVFDGTNLTADVRTQVPTGCGTSVGPLNTLIRTLLASRNSTVISPGSLSEAKEFWKPPTSAMSPALRMSASTFPPLTSMSSRSMVCSSVCAPATAPGWNRRLPVLAPALPPPVLK